MSAHSDATSAQGDSRSGEGSRQLSLARQISDYLDLRHSANVDLAEVVRAVEELTPEGARLFNYGYFELNLLSIFGDSFAAESIRDLALRSVQQRLINVWHGAKQLALTDEPRSELSLEGWDASALNRQLARGRGLILATAHMGPYRLIPRDLAMLGFDVCLALDRHSADTMARPAARWNTARATARDRGLGDWGRLTVCDVEKGSSGTFTVMNALRRGEIVLFFVDGNVGMDGMRGVKNRRAVRFLNRDTSAKTGIAQLAIVTNASLLTAFASRKSGRHVIDVGPCRSFQDAGSGDQSRELAQQWTQEFYAALEKAFLRDPASWEGVKTFHRWRGTPQTHPDEETCPMSLADLEAALIGGAVFRTKRGRVSLFYGTPPVLCDVQGLRSYRCGDEMYGLIRRLHEGPGVDYAAVNQCGIGDRAAALDLLAALRGRGLLDVTLGTARE